MGKEFGVGEKVIVNDSGYGAMDYVDTIKEITRGGNYKLSNGKIFNSSGRLRGGGVWHNPYLEKYTDEKFKEIRRQQLLRFLKYFNWDKITFERLNRIWEITKEV